MDTFALGLVETFGLVPALEAADTALKTADVTLAGLECIGRGLVTVKIRGDISSVKASVEAAKSAAGRLGHVQSYAVIGRTGEGLSTLVSPSDASSGGTAEPAPKASEPEGVAAAQVLPDPSKLSRMRVVLLRKLARSLIAESELAFPMTPEQVKFARKKELVRIIRAFLKAK